MHQLRWHALLQQWVVVSTHRQGRPQMPANWCPFCPGSGHVPEHYDVLLYPNDFPAFSSAADPYRPAAELDAVTGARGACDVVLYSPNHTLAPSQLTPEQWRKVVDVWTSRAAELATNPEIASICIFENCGEAIGVTMPHPHGQIYAMPFVPPMMNQELASQVQFARDHGGACLFCALLQQELDCGKRIVAHNSHFVAFVPFAARFPAEIGIYPRRHIRSLPELEDAERQSLAELIGIIRRKYDNLYGFLLPLMMLVKLAPLQPADLPYHLHLEFLPLQRSRTKLKYLASIETGFGTFLADTAPEDKAQELRASEPVS